MSPAAPDLTFSQPPSAAPQIMSEGSSAMSRFASLRSVQWRINLGILPASDDSSIDDLRRVAADSRRRYAGLRRCLLVDPHIPKDDNKATDTIIDNPLSQNPDSMWGRFFRNAELERVLDQDLSRLYPECGCYFQTVACQTILRRILLLWCLRHPEFGYRQGMHELLAPLLYVLHVDIQQLSEVRELYEDVFSDKFDGVSPFVSDLFYTRSSSPVSSKWSRKKANAVDFQKDGGRFSGGLDELDKDIKTIVLLSDAYGAEGELGVILSERFMEHDAYCMFDALMSGAHGLVAMADYYSLSPASGSLSGLPPVLEASSALYNLLSAADSSLHSHLVELGVEPQYFSLRWLRVLFGREFSLEDLLIIWDDIFASPNNKPESECENAIGSHFMVCRSPRGAFIIAMAVSMLLYLRSSLLATENATACLQRLLKFPEKVNLKKLIDKAKSLQALALQTNSTSSSSVDVSKPSHVRGYSFSSSSVSPKTPLNLLPESYWEEKWRVVNNKDSLSHGSPKGSPVKGRLSLARAESAPSSTKSSKANNVSPSSARRRLLEDLSGDICQCAAGFGDHGSVEYLTGQNPLLDRWERESNDNPGVQNDGEHGHTATEENASVFSDSTARYSGAQENDNESEKSSVTSNSSIFNNDGESNNNDLHDSTVSDGAYSGFGEDCSNTTEPNADPRHAEEITGIVEPVHDGNGEQVPSIKEQKPLWGKFQWFWRFGRNNGEIIDNREAHIETQNAPNNAITGVSKPEDFNKSPSGVHEISENNDNMETQRYQNGSSTIGPGSSNAGEHTSGIRVAPEVPEKNVMASLRNIGQSMLESIQVLESAFQQERGQIGSLESLSRNILSGKGQMTATAALKELRKISNLLSEM